MYGKNADKEVKRSIVMPLVDIPYEFVEVEPANEAAKRLEREKQNLQKLLDEALKAQGDGRTRRRLRGLGQLQMTTTQVWGRGKKWPGKASWLRWRQINE